MKVTVLQYIMPNQVSHLPIYAICKCVTLSEWYSISIPYSLLRFPSFVSSHSHMKDDLSIACAVLGGLNSEISNT